MLSISFEMGYTRVAACRACIMGRARRITLHIGTFHASPSLSTSSLHFNFFLVNWVLNSLYLLGAMSAVKKIIPVHCQVPGYLERGAPARRSFHFHQGSAEEGVRAGCEQHESQGMTLGMIMNEQRLCLKQERANCDMIFIKHSYFFFRLRSRSDRS